MKPRGHEFLQVKGRRWCLCCSLFQWRDSRTRLWLPLRASTEICQRNTPYAKKKCELAVSPLNEGAGHYGSRSGVREQENPRQDS